jgi:hypothetical protein
MTQDTNVQQKFEQTLNRHGYGFQYSVVKLAEQLYPKQSTWHFEATEFPVQVQGQGTRIDILLTNATTTHKPVCMVAECKRANPSLSNWCFAPSPYVHSNGSASNVVLECVRRQNLDNTNMDPAMVQAFPDVVYIQDESFHVALEVRSDERGDPDGKGRGAVEEAATQVLRGLNGMVEFFASHPEMFGYSYTIDLLPVIFTTANLWTSDVNLSDADLATGRVDLTSTDFKRRDWLLYQYHTSPGLKHSYPPSYNGSPLGVFGSFGIVLQREYIRTIPIVSPSGIAEFLAWASALDVR